jgi:hypothetical protein
MPKLNSFARNNLYSLDSLVELHKTWLNQSLTTNSNPVFDSITVNDIQINNDTTIDGDLVLNGNFTVHGNSTLIDSNIVNLKDNIIVVNYSNGSLLSEGGIEIERATTSENYRIVFSESDDRLKIGPKNTTLKPVIPVQTGTLSDGYIPIYNAASDQFDILNQVNVPMKFVKLAVGSNVNYTTANTPNDGVIIQGNVGIGITNPTNKLTLDGNISIGTAYIGFTAPSNGLLVEGRTGFGASNPDSNFQVDVAGSGMRTSKMNIGNSSFNDNILNIIDTNINSPGETGTILIGNTNATSTSNQARLIYNYIGDNDNLNRLDIKLRDSSNGISVLGNGNVGIGTNDPNTYKLQVQGDLNFTGNLYQNGVLFSGGGGSQWITTGSDIYFNAGNVGIGTNNPNTYKLQVQGDLNFTGDLYQNGVLFSGSSQWGTSSNGIQYELGNVGIGTGAYPNYRLAVDGNAYISSDVLLAKFSGNVGVKTDTANYPLHVNGQVYSPHFIDLSQTLTITDISNNTSLTQRNIRLYRLNSERKLLGIVEYAVTSQNTLTEFEITLPERTSNFSQKYDIVVLANGYTDTVNLENIKCYAINATNKAYISFTSSGTSENQYIQFQIEYTSN